MAVAKQCGDEEIADIQELIKSLKAELASVEDWDGDTQDEINVAISLLSNLLRFASGSV
ncbi:hypothetical protein [Pseudomonas sp. ZS1P83]